MSQWNRPLRAKNRSEKGFNRPNAPNNRPDGGIHRQPGTIQTPPGINWWNPACLEPVIPLQKAGIDVKKPLASCI
ncbi:hypothetical protein H9659_13445 [Sporosarcina sp. Sa3CUA8]|uniref:Uncharacterized protein n=1 Tax=Sporosarcina gallistercoris TaxID=2762245 RepID=A0ABR8PMD5_9BACL|nr:hypothetical protein [Sporosarcina gallistercoris]